MTDVSKDIASRRKVLVSGAMQAIRQIVADKGVNRESLDQVKDIVAAMTSESELFSDSEFPSPKPREIAKIYLLADDEGGDFALYLISVLPLRPSPVHDHGTFAVIAGLAGDEENTLYRRLDDKTEPGRATIEEDRRVILSAGDAIAFMPEDIHRINVVSEAPTRHFHLYGKGFDQQTDRLEFNMAQGTTRPASGSFITVDESRRVLQRGPQ